MYYYRTNEEINEIGESIIMKYDYDAYVRGEAIDIEGFVERCLKYSVVYDEIAEDDASKIAFLSDGSSSLKVRRSGNVVKITPSAKTIVLDKSLQGKEFEKKRRFNLAHEAGHIVMNALSGRSDRAAFNTEFEKERAYSFAELHKMFSIAESQATSMGTALLMPKTLVITLLNKLTSTSRIPLYGNEVLADKDRSVVWALANKLNVSYKSMFIRLKHLGVFEYRTMDEFLDNNLCYMGG